MWIALICGLAFVLTLLCVALFEQQEHDRDE
jgi:hypothetical protein